MTPPPRREELATALPGERRRRRGSGPGAAHRHERAGNAPSASPLARRRHPRPVRGAARPPRGESRRAAAGRGAELHPVDRIAPCARAVRQWRRRRRCARPPTTTSSSATRWPAHGSIPATCRRLIGGHGAAALFHPGSGAAYWYLTFKNFVVNAGLRPKAVVFFFRDENLTDTLFRVYPSALDRVARQREPVLDETPRGAVAGHVLPAARRRPPRLPARPDASLARAPHHPRAGRAGRPDDPPGTRCSTRSTTRCSRSRRCGRWWPPTWRPPAARRSTSTGTSRRPCCPRSSACRRCPASASRSSGSSGGRPRTDLRRSRPRSSGTCGDCGRYLQSNGAIFHDDWGDPDQPLSAYEDGDHLKKEFRRTYTEIFFRKNPEIFR